MPPRPSGTVTFLFTDIEGSTRLWEEHPEAMATALVRHDTLLRSTIESAGGYVFKTVGDAFCAAFTGARDAVGAAGAAQRALHAEAWPDGATLRVRMAMHTGECVERDGDYFGPVVNRTARLGATAHGGQVVISRSTADLVGDALPPGTTLVDLGSHRLKDLDRAEDVFQVTVEGVPADFPPLRSQQTAAPTNLTESVSSFVGRDVEVGAVVKLLGANRLVTLAGAGGVGKTRLATEVGRTLLPESTDGVWLVELATWADPASVPSAVLGSLGIGEKFATSALDTLVAVLAPQERVIILDNCEHVIDGAAAVAEALLRGCPGVTLLTTSREPLRIEGEITYRVPSLSLPPEHVDERSDLAGSGAVALFVERAAVQAPGFELRDDDAPLVAAICRQLDGMPLALELATARLRSMSLRQMHDRLEQRFGLLTGGSRTALPRHQTLRALVDWSYDLLTDAERALMRRASVFVDGFDLEAAEAVCALDDIARFDITDLLASLVDKSLVTAEPRGSAHRYRLQETLRQYGAERLAEAGAAADAREAEAVVAAHSRHYLDLAELAAPELDGRRARAWLGRLTTDEFNLRLAIEHALATPEGAERVLRQFWSLYRYWTDAPQPVQTLALLERALAQAGDDFPAARRVEALICKGVLLAAMDARLELDAMATAVGLAREIGDRAREADALSRYSRCLAQGGRDEEALAAGADAVALARRIDAPVLLGKVLFQYASVLDEADDPGADAAYREALAMVEQTGDELTAWKLHNNFALFLLGRGDLTDARRHFETALIGSELTARSAQLYFNLGWLLLEEGDPHSAASSFVDILRTNRLSGTSWLNPYAVLGLACCATQRDEPERAATLHGGADSLIVQSAVQWESLEETIRARDIAALRERMGGAFDRHYAAGRAMPNDEIIKLAATAS